MLSVLLGGTFCQAASRGRRWDQINSQTFFQRRKRAGRARQRGEEGKRKKKKKKKRREQGREERIPIIKRSDGVQRTQRPSVCTRKAQAWLARRDCCFVACLLGLVHLLHGYGNSHTTELSFFNRSSWRILPLYYLVLIVLLYFPSEIIDEINMTLFKKF